MWIDADTIQINSLTHLFELLRHYDVIGYDWPSGQIFGSTIIGPIRARHPLLQIWNEKTNEILTFKLKKFVEFASEKNQTKYPLDWAEILSDLLNPAMRRLLNERKTNYYRLDGYENYGGLFKIGLSGHLFTEIHSTNLDRIDLLFDDSISPLIIFHNRNVGSEWKNISLDEFVRKDTIFKYIWKRSMKNCMKNFKRNATKNC